jgi:hypothetical protein
MTTACSAAQASAPTCWQSLDASIMPSPQPPAFALTGEPALDGSGISAAVDIALPSAATPAVFRVYATNGAAACLQVEKLVDAAGSAWVTPPASGLDYGNYCQSCPQRASVGVGSALYVLPSSDPLPASATDLQLSIAERDCTTFLPASAGTLAPLRIETLAGTAVDDARDGTVLLQIAITPGSVWHDDADAFPASLSSALDEVNALLSPGHLSVRAVRVRRIAGEDPIVVERGEHAALDRVGATLYDCDPGGQSPDDTWVPVVLVGCLQMHDPLRQQTTEVDGLVPHIPDGFPAAGHAHGVYLKGHGCSPGATPAEIDPQTLGKLLAHELGHYLGLYHSVEADGTADALADTTADNIMNYSPLQVAAPGFTTGQFRVMRRHPAIRW